MRHYLLFPQMQPLQRPDVFVAKQKLAHTSLKFSPIKNNLLAVTSAANFGIVGKGIVQVKVMEAGTLKTVAMLEEKDAFFDLSWCQFNEQFMLLGCGNGQVTFWNIQKGKMWVLETQNEVQSVEFAYKNPLFLATNMNGALRMGESQKGAFLFMLPAHRGSCYQAQWHPTSEKVFASGGGDGFLKIWDHSLPNKNIASVKAHEGEIMSIDFNKYDEIIATASTDKTVRLWDLRNLKIPMNIIGGHRYAIRRVKFSPHVATLLATGSYDMNVHVYDTKDPMNPLKIKHAQHTEFVTALDFSLFHEKLIASASWDGRILAWEFDKPQPIIT